MAYRRKKKAMNSEWTAERIKKLRAGFDESQQVFSTRLGVAIGTLQFWEQGHGSPTRIGQKYLERLEQDLASDLVAAK